MKESIHDRRARLINQNIETRDRLVKECQDLLYEVASIPGCLKHLTDIKNMLQTYANYKANRRK